jgi:hypothetical protein
MLWCAPFARSGATPTASNARCANARPFRHLRNTETMSVDSYKGGFINVAVMERAWPILMAYENDSGKLAVPGDEVEKYIYMNYPSFVEFCRRRDVTIRYAVEWGVSRLREQRDRMDACAAVQAPVMNECSEPWHPCRGPCDHVCRFDDRVELGLTCPCHPDAPIHKTTRLCDNRSFSIWCSPGCDTNQRSTVVCPHREDYRVRLNR